MYFVWFVDPFESAERSVLYEIHQIHEPGNRRHYPEFKLTEQTPHEQLPQTCPFRGGGGGGGVYFVWFVDPLTPLKVRPRNTPNTRTQEPRHRSRARRPTLPFPLIHEIYAIHGQTSGANAPTNSSPDPALSCLFRVVPAVARRHPHRPGRAQLTHPVPRREGFAKRRRTIAVDRVAGRGRCGGAWQSKVSEEAFCQSRALLCRCRLRLISQ